jgi:hypothetical protein
MLHLSLNNLDLKGGTVLITTPVNTKSSVSKFKIRPNKVYCKLVFKGNYWHLISLLPKGIYDVAYITKNIPYIGNDCGYNQLVSKINQTLLCKY